ncbi:MAG: MoaD/ThiS family protein [archaeon]
MKIFIEKDKQSIKKKFNGKVGALLSSLKINSSTVLVVSNGELITEEDVVKDSDDVKILSVISGG